MIYRAVLFTTIVHYKETNVPLQSLDTSKCALPSEYETINKCIIEPYNNEPYNEGWIYIFCSRVVRCSRWCDTQYQLETKYTILEYKTFRNNTMFFRSWLVFVYISDFIIIVLTRRES